MTGNKVFRTGVVRSAAAAILESFQNVNVRCAIYGDLAWHLLCGSYTSGSWRLEAQVMGDSSTLTYATQHLASADHRFSLASRGADGEATMTYIHDVLNDGSPAKKHQCKVKFVSGQLENVLIVEDFPLLPIQSTIYRRMESCVNKSQKKLKNCMSEVVAISEAYHRLPNRPRPVWSLTPTERPLFLEHLTKITAAFPESADLLDRLHPRVFPTTTLVPTPPSIVFATRSDSTVILDRDQLGHDCFLAGPGYVPWYIMGSPIVPTSHDINFLVVLRNGTSLDSLQRILSRKGAFLFSMLWRDGKPRSCIGTDFHGISIINQNYLFFTLLRTYKNVVAVLELLSHRNTDVRAAFEDGTRVDQLTIDIVTIHPELGGYFTTVGFRTALPPIQLSRLSPSEVDVQTVCGSTPAVRIPTVRGKRGIVFQAAVDATCLLQDSGHTCAIFGSAACYLYGNKRRPHDVDILVSSSQNAELIKQNLVNQDPLHFYFKKAKDPKATYQLLQSCKVDILTPGTMMLPLLSASSVVVKQGLPLVPLEVLLLHKLKGWRDHMRASKRYKRIKQTADVADIRCILKIVLRSLKGNERLFASVALSFFRKKFQRLTMVRVKRFWDDWYRLGFEVA
ncbi:hypothetical protein F5146DRAFT_1054167 [Armillaria mellea]|nr:hypothetical protein F5146DRAFT_1054167 [Armillaria mellea]